MLFGKIKDSNEYGFGIFEDKFDSYVEVDDDEHMELIDKANNENKQIVPDENGYPILIDRPPLNPKDAAQIKIQELKGYLLETDWYTLRFIEEGIPIPDEIKEKRHNARVELSELEKVLKNN